MKSKVLMAALVVTLLMGVRVFASPCDPACDPCGACDGCVKSCDLFSGLKKLVNGIRSSDCGPCDGVVACNPCDDAAACNPCDEIACSSSCLPKIELGKRLRNLFASQSCNPCDAAGDCKPCDEVQCDPCGETSCDNSCFARKFSLRNLFKGVHLNRGCETECGSPCDNVDSNCAPCDNAGNCAPCDEIDSCGSCKGHLLDLPRFNLKKLFDGFGKCDTGCNPCDQVGPCDSTCIR